MFRKYLNIYYVPSTKLDRNGLSGTLVSELKVLSSLQYLVLEDGVISGSIPSEIGLNSMLQVIDLNFNFIGGKILYVNGVHVRDRKNF